MNKQFFIDYKYLISLSEAVCNCFSSLLFFFTSICFSLNSSAGSTAKL